MTVMRGQAPLRRTSQRIRWRSTVGKRIGSFSDRGVWCHIAVSLESLTCKRAAGEVSPAKQIPHRPCDLAPALGLRAGNAGLLIVPQTTRRRLMNRLRNFVRCGVKCGFVVLLLCGLSPAIASAHSVRGHGRVPEPEPLLDSLISVDAWLDASGVPQG